MCQQGSFIQTKQKTLTSMGSWELFTFSHICQLPSSLCDSLPEVIVTGNKIKRTDTVSRIMYSSWFKQRRKHLR